MSILSTGGGGSLSLPVNLGPGLFQIDAHGNVSITPNAPRAVDPWGNNPALGVTAPPGGDAFDFFGSPAMGQGLGDVFGPQGPGQAIPALTTLYFADESFAIILEIDPGPPHKIGFFGVSPAARQTLTSATATPEQIALALEASTLMGGT